MLLMHYRSLQAAKHQEYFSRIDGYDQRDNRNKIINEIFYAYKENKGSKPITSITPTKYNFATISIYAI